MFQFAYPKTNMLLDLVSLSNMLNLQSNISSKTPNKNRDGVDKPFDCSSHTYLDNTVGRALGFTTNGFSESLL